MSGHAGPLPGGTLKTATTAAPRKGASPRRVLFLTTGYPHPSAPGAGGFVAELAEAFVTEGWHVQVLAPALPHGVAEGPSEPGDARSGTGGRRPASPTPGSGGITLRRIRYTLPFQRPGLFYGAGGPENLSTHPSLALQAPGFAAALGWHAARAAVGADLVVGHWLVPSGLVAGWAAARAGARSGAVCHSGGLWLLERIAGGRYLARALLRRCHRIVFVAEVLRRRFAALLSSRERVDLQARSTVLAMGVTAPPPLPAPERATLRASLGLGGGGPLLLFMGRLVPIKGLDMLLGALAGLRARLVVAGEGPQRGQLRRLAARLGVDCRLVGWVQGRRKKELLQAADALVLPSRVLHGRTEGAPVAAMEALACGLPVLASPTGGLTELVVDGVNGYLADRTGGCLQASWAALLRRICERPQQLRRLRTGAARSARGMRWSERGPALVAALSGARGC